MYRNSCRLFHDVQFTLSLACTSVSNNGEQNEMFDQQAQKMMKYIFIEIRKGAFMLINCQIVLAINHFHLFLTIYINNFSPELIRTAW